MHSSLRPWRWKSETLKTFAATAIVRAMSQADLANRKSDTDRVAPMPFHRPRLTAARSDFRCFHEGDGLYGAVPISAEPPQLSTRNFEPPARSGRNPRELGNRSGCSVCREITSNNHAAYSTGNPSQRNNHRRE